MKSRFTPASHMYCAVLFVLMVLCAPVSLRAQEVRGKISGSVTDQNKAAVAGATVQVTDVARNKTVTLTTNTEGLFDAPYLLPGLYQVVVEASGFKKSIQAGVQVQINETRSLDIALEVGGTQETVTVTAEPAALNLADGNLGQTVDQKRLAELPLVHGDPYTLIGLSPGIAYTGASRLDRPFEPTHIANFAMNGARGIRSDLLIDGAPSTATANANEVIASYVPPSDITQEFKVQTTTYDAQFGNTEGGVTSIAIKSGTNQFHGTAYYWTEPGGLAANDVFGKARGQGRPFTFSNRPGFNISGPVTLPRFGEGGPSTWSGKNKTFFLFSYEGIRDSRPRFDIATNNPLTWVPTQALKDGNFSAFIGGQSNFQIYDPTTGILGTGSNGCPAGSTCNRVPFAGGIIPAGRINPVAKAILPFFGSPKNPGLSGNIFDSQLPELTKPYDNYTIRLDQNIGDNDRLFGRYSWYNRNSTYNNYTGTAYFGDVFGFVAKQAVIDEVHTFNANTILNVRYGYNRFIRISDMPPESQGFDLTTLAFPASFNNQVGEGIRRFPRFDFPANTTLPNGHTNENRPVGSHFVTAVLNRTENKHSLKFGGELRIYREDDSFASNNQSGQFGFDNTYTRQGSVASADPLGLQAFAAFLLGYPSQMQIVRAADYSEYSKTWGFFGQDDWRLTNKLTLNLGLRWEFETPLVERQNKSVSGFDTAYVQPFEAAAQANYTALNDAFVKSRVSQITTRGGLLFAGQDTGKGLYNTPKNGFLPRLGLAYQLNDKTVLRGGFGLFQGFLGERRGDVIQPGFSITTSEPTTTNPNGTQIPVSLSNPFPSGIKEPTGANAGKQTSLGGSATFFNQDPKASKQARWSIGIQRELWGHWTVEANYVGDYGYDIEIVRNLNALPVQFLNADNSRTVAMGDNDTALRGTVANPFRNLNEFRGTTFFNATIARQQLLLPFPEFTSVTTTNNDGKTWYHSAQFSVQKRFSQGYGMQFAYTWSKWLQATEYLNSADPEPTKMISDQDIPHRFSMSGFYELPIGKGKQFLSNAGWWTNAILGGWQIDGTYVFQSGFPVAFGAYNPTTGVTSGDLFYNGGDIALPSDQRTTSRWFNTAAFVSIVGGLPTCSGFATPNANCASPVNHLRTLPFRFSNVRIDSINNADMGLRKDIQLREGMKIQLRMEYLNAFNHPLLPVPVVTASNAQFGQVTGSNQLNYARRAQLGVKFIF